MPDEYDPKYFGGSDRVVSTESHLEEFKKSTVWQDIETILKHNLRVTREWYTNAPDWETHCEIRGRELELLHVLGLPDLLIEFAREQQEDHKIDEVIQGDPSGQKILSKLGINV